MQLSRKTFLSGMAALGTVFDKDINSTILQDIYWDRLKNYTDDEVSTAFKMAVDKCKFFPRPVELLEFITAKTKPSPDVKWAGVLEIMRRYDGLRDMKVIVDGATAFAIRNMGGWQSLTMMNTDQIPFQVTRFRALYEQACQNGLDKEQGDIEGRREKNWQTGEFYNQKIVAPPETLLPPHGAKALQSQEQKQIEGKMNQITSSLKGKMSF